MNVLQSALADPVMLVPIAVFCIVFGLAIAVSERQSQVSTRLARHRIGGSSAVLMASGETRGSWRSRMERPAALDRLAAMFNSEKKSALARALLNQAGAPMSLEKYLRMGRIFTFVVTPVLATLALVGLGLKPLGFAAVAIVVITVPRLPGMYLKRIAKKRAKEMDTVISDVLDLLVVCVEGGQSLSAALLQLSNRMENVAAEEFRRLLSDINSGMSRRDAFTALAERCQSEALSIACTTIIHADKVGMSLGHTLRTLSDMMRTRRRQAAETRARQAPIKMMPVLVGFMLPTMLALLIGPVALEVMEVFK